MDFGIISMRYARALLRFATENGEAEKVYTETDCLAQAFLKVPALHGALLNPVVSDAQKERLLLSAATDDEAGKCSGSFCRFVSVAIAKKRADLMVFIAHSYGTLYRKANHIIKGTLTVSAPVSSELVGRLREMAEKRSGEKVDFQVEEDAAICGGFVLRYGTYCLDASVRTHLAKLHRELSR